MKLIAIPPDSDGKPKDECGIVGIYGNPKAANLAYLGLYALQHRGQESAGIASSDGHHIYRYAGMGKVIDVFTQEHINNLQGHMAIGHNRYSTTGSSFLRNAQPFRSESILGPIVLAHNGNLTNAGALRYELEKKGHIFQTTIDSEVIVHLMAQVGDRGLPGGPDLRAQAGAGRLLAPGHEPGQDLRGARPLRVPAPRAGQARRRRSWSRPRPAPSTSSTRSTCARSSRARSSRYPTPAIKSYRPFEKKDQSLCVFEYIYFSRPDSIIFGKSVYDMRISLGRMLARQAPVEADIVVPIPDSSVCAAIGYSRESGIPYELGLIRSHYIGRTFIEPSQKIRDFGAKIKYNVVRASVAGKRIVVVDDSIMRGHHHAEDHQDVPQRRREGDPRAHIRAAHASSPASTASTSPPTRSSSPPRTPSRRYGSTSASTRSST